MAITLQEISSDALNCYADIQIAFEVTSEFRIQIVDAGLGGITLREEAVASPYVKDYDAEEGGGPRAWLEQFDIRNWAFFLALENDQRVGGVAIAHNTAGVHMLEGRGDLAIVWDLRVDSTARGRGVGKALLRHAADWARARGCRQLKVETQNINVPACRFYAQMGCRLGVIDRYAYSSTPAVAHEVMLNWYLDL